MALYDQTGLAPSESPKTGTVWVARGRADFKVLANKLGRTVMANDSVKVIDLPAGTTLIGGSIHSPRVEGATLTIDTGVSEDDNGIDDAFNANNNTTPLAFGTKPLFEGDVDYPLNSATSIYVTPMNNAATAVIDVVLFCVTHTNTLIQPD